MAQESENIAASGTTAAREIAIQRELVRTHDLAFTLLDMLQTQGRVVLTGERVPKFWQETPMYVHTKEGEWPEKSLTPLLLQETRIYVPK